MKTEFNKLVSLSLTLEMTSDIAYPENKLGGLFSELATEAEQRQIGEADLLIEVLEQYLTRDEVPSQEESEQIYQRAAEQQQSLQHMFDTMLDSGLALVEAKVGGPRLESQLELKQKVHHFMSHAPFLKLADAYQQRLYA